MQCLFRHNLEAAATSQLTDADAASAKTAACEAAGVVLGTRTHRLPTVPRKNAAGGINREFLLEPLVRPLDMVVRRVDKRHFQLYGVGLASGVGLATGGVGLTAGGLHSTALPECPRVYHRSTGAQ